MSFKKVEAGKFGPQVSTTPKVSIRKNSISFNAELIAQANEPGFVTFYVDVTKVLIVFSQIRTEGALKVSISSEPKSDFYRTFRRGGSASANSLLREIGDVLTSYKWASKAKYDASPYEESDLKGWIIDLRKPLIGKKGA